MSEDKLFISKINLATVIMSCNLNLEYVIAIIHLKEVD